MNHPGITNPLEGVEHVFAADRPIYTLEGSLFSRPAFVSLRAMDAGADAHYASLLHQAASAALPDIDGLHTELLASTVVEFSLWTLSKVKDPLPGEPETVPCEVRSEGMDPAQRRRYFAAMDKEFRKRLVRACAEVNGLDPLVLGLSPIPESAKPSPPPVRSIAASEPEPFNTHIPPSLVS